MNRIAAVRDLPETMGDRRDTSMKTHPDDALVAYANHTLDPAEQAALEAHLADCDRCREELDWLSTLRAGMQAEPLPAVDEVGLARLMREVKAEQGSAPATTAAPSWWRGAMAAAVLVMLVQFGVIATQWQPDAGYQPLSESGQAVGPVLQVRFAPTTSLAEMQALLEQIEGRIVDGPGALGLYRIALPEDANGEDALATLKAADGIVIQALAEPTP
jgi:anti-sigma factor RsiW